MSFTFFTFGTSRGKNSFRAINRKIDISIFHHLHFLEKLYSFVKTVLKGQPVLGGAVSKPFHNSDLTGLTVCIRGYWA